MIKKLNNKGYLLIEIIVSFVIAMGVAYFLSEVTINLKDKEEDLDKEIGYNADKYLITKEIMDDVNKYGVEKVSKIENGVHFRFKNGYEKNLIVSVKEGVTTIEYGNESGIYSKSLDKSLEVGELYVGKNSSDGVTDNLIRYYDAINNMGESHSNDTLTWKDLSDHQDATITNCTFTTNYLDIGTNGWVNLGQINDKTQFTIDVSVTLDSIQSGEVDLVSNFESGGFGLVIEDGRPGVAVWFPSSTWYTFIVYDKVLKTNRNYRISATYNGDIINLYLDGVLVESLKGTGSIKNPVNNTVMTLGADPSGNGIYILPGEAVFDGKFYSVRIYDAALTQSKIQQNMYADNSLLIKLPATSIYSNKDYGLNLVILADNIDI